MLRVGGWLGGSKNKPYGSAESLNALEEPSQSWLCFVPPSVMDSDKPGQSRMQWRVHPSPA